MLRVLLSSKKFVVSLAGITAVLTMKLAGTVGVLDRTTADEVATYACVIISTYVLAQGIADHGKEAAKLDTKKAEVRFTTKGGHNLLLEDRPNQ